MIESLPPDPLLRLGTEGAVCIDPGITPPVSILGDPESESREESTALQE